MSLCKLLSVSSDAKTIKGEYFGILTGILYLAPYNLSGYQVCPMASKGCAAACLFTAGHGIYKKVQDSRIKRTKMFFEDRENFMAIIVEDIAKVVRKAKRLGMTPAIRLNGTSDIAWEKFRVNRDGVSYRNIMEAFPDVQFYDYSKILGRKTALKIKNYHLTFSLAEDNDANALVALEEGYNVAVVMNIPRAGKLPKKWGGYPVIDGDKNDLRFLDKKGGHIVGLRMKGKARSDTSGFVRDHNGSFNMKIPFKLVA